MASCKVPTAIDGGQSRQWTNDDETHSLLRKLLTEIRILNIQLACITGQEIDDTEVPSPRN